MKTITIKGSNWFNYTGLMPDMKELAEAIEICYAKDMERLKKAPQWDKARLLVEYARKYPHHKIV